MHVVVSQSHSSIYSQIISIKLLVICIGLGFLKESKAAQFFSCDCLSQSLLFAA